MLLESFQKVFGPCVGGCLPVFSSRSSHSLGLTPRSLIYFEWVFVKGESYELHSILLHVETQFPQY